MSPVAQSVNAVPPTSSDWLDAPLALYVGETRHARLQPFRRQLRFSLFSLWLDITRLNAVAAQSKSLRINAKGIFSFWERDHGGRDGSNLEDWARSQFHHVGVEGEIGSIFILCFPRMFGYVFNPLSVYFAYTPEGSLRAVLYEVHNTFGETHSYVTPIPARTGSEAARRFEAPKRFHVSPFFGVEGRYRFHLRAPGESFGLKIENWRGNELDHIALLQSRRVEFSDRKLHRLAWALPLMSVQVILAIHWHALFLWLRGAHYRAKPAPQTPNFTATQPMLVTSSSPIVRDAT